MRSISGFMLLALLVGFGTSVHGQRVVGGTISDTLWTIADNPVTVVGNLTIPVGQTLVIGAGVEIQFVANATFTVNGELKMLGTANNPVKIGLPVANASGGNWRGIRVQSGASFEMRHTILSRADIGIDLRPSAIPVNISNNIFENNTTGIYTERPMIFTYNLLTNNTTAGIVFDGLVTKDSLKYNNFCNVGTNVINKRYATVNLSGNGWCSGDTAFIQASLKRQGNNSGTIIYAPFDLQSINGMVFPGDANYNKVVNMEDLFAIGYAYGDTGAVRPFASTTWIGQQAPDWTDSLPNGANIKHADCNGDGVVDSFDTGAILFNFMQTHNGGKLQQADTVPVFSFTINDTIPYFAGDTIAIPISIGQNMPILNFYGMAFTVDYDTNMVNIMAPNPIQVVVDTNAWIGTPAVELISLQETFVPGRREVGITRINHTSVSGSGKVADIIVILSDDVSKKTDTVDFTISISNVVAVNENLEAVPLGGGSATIRVTLPTLAERAAEAVGLKLVPNPARDQVRLTTTQPGQQVLLLDMAGRELMRQPMNGTSAILDVSPFAAGTYLLRVDTHAGSAMKLLSIE